MRTAVNSERLKTLFQAYRDQNNTAFVRAAETIIADELAANHHSAATELKQALGPQHHPSATSMTKATELAALPKDRRNGEDLFWVNQHPALSHPVVFAPETEARINRVLEEHRRRVRLQRSGLRPKTKLLFWGDPGTGKTLTACYLAQELGLPLAIVRLSAVISSFLGDTAGHLQRIFSRANASPMVLLLDEADAIGKKRDDPNDVGELKRVVNSLLQAIDAFQSAESILIAASNHQYLLDLALWRRFDDVIRFPLPGRKERERFLHLFLNGVSLEGSIPQIAVRMASLSYADIEHVIVEALKTMILADRETLLAKDIAIELQSWKKTIREAQRKDGTSR